MIQLDLIRAPQSWIIILVGLTWYVYRRIRNHQNVKSNDHPSVGPKAKTNDIEYSEDAYYNIEPLSDFDLEHTEPIKIRPFKPKYHITMAIENTTLSDLVAMDNTYLSRIGLRKSLIQNRQSDVLAVKPVVSTAVLEFYDWLITTYLPRHFPTLFTILPSTGLRNHVTGEVLPLKPSSAEEALRVIGANIDDDFLFLLPIPEGDGDASDAGKYRLEGFVTCFPSGFNTPHKLGMKLADIHGPVPSYSEKLEKSMDRFFASLPVGKIVKRHNWSMTTNRDLFCLAGTHLTPEEVAERAAKADKEDEDEEVNIDQTVLRCERQTLHRLPKSKALVFGFKTYQYGLRELRDEGVGEDLANAIEGLGKGNAPGMVVYKRQVVWGAKVASFLRGEIDD